MAPSARSEKKDFVVVVKLLAAASRLAPSITIACCFAADAIAGWSGGCCGHHTFDVLAWPAHRRVAMRLSPVLSTSARSDLTTLAGTAAVVAVDYFAAIGADYQRRQRPVGLGLTMKAVVVVAAGMQRTRQRSASRMGQL